MSASLVVAIAAGVIACLSLFWQVFSWRHSHRPHIEVKVVGSFLVLDNGDLIDAVVLRAINRSDHKIRVASMGPYAQDGSGRTLQPSSEVPGATIPGGVAVQDSGETYFVFEEIEASAGIDRYQPLKGWVKLATGETIQSKSVTLWKH